MLKKVLAACAVCAAGCGSGVFSAQAQEADLHAHVPHLFSQEMRQEKPDLQSVRMVRFVTTSDFPPFQSLGEDKTPRGYNVDLVRAMCAELDKICTVQALPWGETLEWLRSGRADAVIAGHRPTSRLRQEVDFAHPYFRLPARFAVVLNSPLNAVTPQQMDGKTVAVLKGTAHEAFVRTYFQKSKVNAVNSTAQLLAALEQKTADAAFGDGVQMAQALNLQENPCCRMVGESYFESHFFGEGMAIAVRKGDKNLKSILDYTLATLEARGMLSEIYLRWFPVGIYSANAAQ